MVTDEVVAGRAHRRPPLSMRLAESVARRLGGARPSRRSVLTTTAVAGSAIAVAPWRFLTRPVSAYDTVCGPANECAAGWTVFCCTINAGRNECPPGSIAAGWWKADINSFCGGGPRYYVDCNSTCGDCGCGPNGICGPECWSCGCRCNDDPSTCDHRRVCCNQFRYGNCNQELPCVGSVVCRVVSCVPPWVWEPSCTNVAATNDRTGDHAAPCLDTPIRHLYSFGDATALGEGRGTLRSAAVSLALRPQGDGAWVVALDGSIRTFGSARRHGSFASGEPVHPIVDLEPTPSGRGYWLVSTRGRVWNFGDAPRLGSVAVDLVKPIVSMARTSTGAGYWLVNANGRVFAFGDAQRWPGPSNLPAHVCAIVPTPSDEGYWLVARSGRVVAFGDAVHRGSPDPATLNARIVGMVSAPDGRGYAMVDDRGRVHRFGSMRHFGGFGSVNTPHGPVFGIVPTSSGGGYVIGAQPG